MAQYATPDPEYATLFAKIPHREPSKDLKIARERVEKYFVSISQEHFRPQLPKDAEYRVQDHQVPTRSGTTLVRTVTPTPVGEEKDFPCLVWIHGGGWTAGSLNFDDFRLRIVSVELRISIVNVEYRLAPEHPFPAGLNDGYDALKWAAEYPQLFGTSLSKGFFIGGMSAGANMVASIVHRARDDPYFQGKRLTGQILQLPPVIHPDFYPDQYKDDLRSMFIEENKEMTLLTRAMLRDSLGHLGGLPSDPEVSPLLYPSHADLPPTFIQVAGLDVLRDDGLLYERVLREAGVKTRLNIYPGVPHGFNLTFPNLKASVKLESDLKDGIKWLLSGSP